ncbi:hypothetical protein MNBD_BACTEROID07-1677 [hydrothermal vent metagenome]|uniref:SpoVT-AbrB domain-containing protein n=1 Tax=hydrothermal vent metagenome TaxID=652676 RepID=A0A3B0UBD2_9ZZZZ
MAATEHQYWNERVIQKNNTGTYTISVPVDMIRNLRWKQGQRVVVENKGKTIIIKDAPRR